MRSRIIRVAVAVTLFFLMAGASWAQTPWWGQRGPYGWGYQNNDREKAYEHGLRDGRNDREHRRGWHPRHDGQAYLNGYRAGYGRNGGGWQGRRDNDGPYRGGYGNGPYGNGPYGNGPYGNGPYRGNDVSAVAYNNGFQTGLSYGAADRNNGHSFRPTYSSTYQNGTSGYQSSYGSETAYKHSFQNGYRAGYQRGYYGR